MDLSTFAVQQVIIHQIPKMSLKDKQDALLAVTEAPSELTPSLRTYMRERITDSLQAQRFTAVYEESEVLDGEDTPVSKQPSPVPRYVLDFFQGDGSTFVDISQDVARYLFSLQSGNNSEGMLALVEGTVTTGSSPGKCLAVLKLEMSGALTITPATTPDGKTTFAVDVKDITLKKDATVFKAALFARAGSLADLRAIVSDNQRDKSRYGSEIADFFLHFLGCRLVGSAERETKGYLQYVDNFINSVDDGNERTKLLLASFADMTSNSSCRRSVRLCSAPFDT